MAYDSFSLDQLERHQAVLADAVTRLDALIARMRELGITSVECDAAKGMQTVAQTITRFATTGNRSLDEQLLGVTVTQDKRQREARKGNQK